MQIKTVIFFVTAQSYSYFFSLCGTSDYLSIKYTSAGNSVFETRYDGSGSGPDESVAFDTDASGNLYVTDQVSRLFLNLIMRPLNTIPQVFRSGYQDMTAKDLMTFPQELNQTMPEILTLPEAVKV
ncbi:MAG: hypothetical protein IPM38_19145 [Ignavibacteria bacterium]|nr:hypothetical protein [Ignavibacteria bacterium]